MPKIKSPELKLESSREKIIAYVVVLVIVVATAFYSSLQNQFLNWDDTVNLTQNADIRSLSLNSLKTIFGQTIHKIYIPLTQLSYAVEYFFFKYNAFVYHLDNLLLHIANTILIFFLGNRLGLKLRASFCAALIFGIHPMHVESVAWISERKDVLYTLFYLLAFHSYLNYILQKNKRDYGLSILWGLLSMLAKPMALSLPLILFLCDWFYGRRGWAKLFIEKIPYFIYIIPLVLITHQANSGIFVFDPDWGKAVLISLWSATFYIRKFFWPDFFSPVYQLPEPVVMSSLPYIVAISIVVALLTGVVVFRKNKWFIFAVGFYIFSIFYFIRYDESINTSFVADRYMYLASLGFCFLLGFVADQLLRLAKRSILLKVFIVVSGILVSGFLGYKTFRQCHVWKDSLTFWNHVLRFYPNIYYAYLDRGVAYLSMGDEDAAFKDYNKAIELKPDYAKGYFNRGVVYLMKKEYDLAILDFNKAIEIDGSIAEIYYQRGNLHRAVREVSEALADYNKAISLNPRLAIAYLDRGFLLGTLRQYDLAIKDFNKVLLISPENSLAYYNRSVTYKFMDQFDLALEDALTAQSLGLKNIDSYIQQLKDLLAQPKE